MTRSLVAALAIVAVAGSIGLAAAEQTWTGFISDSHCGAAHRNYVERGDLNTARECVIGRPGDADLPGCVSAKHGAKFVVVVGETVYGVANQDFKELRTLAAEPVTITGSLRGDIITVSKIVRAK
jgi:hypothetical protein